MNLNLAVPRPTVALLGERVRTRSLPVQLTSTPQNRKRSLAVMLSGSMAPQPSMRRAILLTGTCREMSIQLVRVELNGVIHLPAVERNDNAGNEPQAAQQVDDSGDVTAHMVECLHDSITRKLI